MLEVLWYIGGVVFIALGIGFSIGWHELGHLLPAKRFGIKVPKYMIGFGPTLFSRQRGETEYGLKLIPLGGFISMIGMYPPAKKGSKKRKGFFADSIEAARTAHSVYVTKADVNRKFYQLPVYKRIIIMFGGPFMNLFLGVLLTVVTLTGIGSYGRATTIDSVVECVPSDFSKDVACKDSDPISPAKAAGLVAGAKVISVNGQSVSNWDEVAAIAAEHPGALALKVVTAEKTKSVELNPVLVSRPVTQSDGSTKNEKVPYFGVVLKLERQQQSLATSLGSATTNLTQTFGLIATLPVQVYRTLSDTISNQPRANDGAVSLIGVGQVAGQIASNQQASLLDKISGGLMMLASLNFALFAFNMIPLLPLDGGHITGAIYEAIKRGIWRLRRKGDPGPADTALLMPITYLVTIALIAMSLVLLIADLVNPMSI